MKMNRLYAMIIGLSTLFGLMGCSTLNTGADPVVVRAEQTSQIAFSLIDRFLKWEYDNRAILPQDVRQSARQMRQHAPEALITLKTLTKAYKKNRTEAGKADLLTALAVVEALQSQAIEILAKYSKDVK